MLPFAVCLPPQALGQRHRARTNPGAERQGQRTSPSALKIRTSSPSSSPARPHPPGASAASLPAWQLGERRADGALAGRRNQRQRVFRRAGVGLIPVQARWRSRVERVREQVDLAVRRQRKHVDELNGPALERRSRDAVLAQVVANRLAAASTARRASLRARPSGRRPAAAPCASVSSPKTSAFEPCLADRLDDRPAELQTERAVRARAGHSLPGTSWPAARHRHTGRVGHHLLEDDREQVVALDRPFRTRC